MRFAREEKKGRFIAMIIIFICIFLAFSLILVNTQIVHGEDYIKQSSASSSSTEVKATRGQILDRNGNVLVGSRQGNEVIFDASEFPSLKEQEKRNKLILSLINLFENNNAEWINDLPITLDDEGNYQFIENRENDIAKLKARDMLHLNKYATADECMSEITEKYSLQKYSKGDALKIASVCCALKMNLFNTANPYVFANDVDDSIVSVIKENSKFYTGVDVQVVTYREYTDGTIAPHILGVTGVINAEEYAELKEKGYAMDDVLGKSGIEKVFEDNLKGTNGLRTVTTSSDGTKTTTVDGLKNGDNIVLTIDSELQKVAQNALKKTCVSVGTANSGGGAVIAMDCRTGEILAMASYPTYDLSTYYDDYNDLIKNVNSPLFNRATLSTYAPGSTAKVSTAIACLEEGIIDENSTKYCAFNYPFKGHNFVCQINHSNRTLTVRTALQDSCNSFFYYYGGEKLGIDKMNMYREMLGLGQPTGIEIAEATGVLDSPSYRTSIGQKWMPGFSLQSAIGQAGNLFTPLQLCNYVSTVANGGTRYEAHIIKSILSYDNSTTVLNKEPKAVLETGFKKNNVDTVKAGMRLVVTRGTCKDTFGKLDIAVACKTGTSQVDKVIGGHKATYTNGFNISFAPYDNPEIAVAVAIEGATSGGSCAPVACDIYNYYFHNMLSSSSEDEDEIDLEEENETETGLLR